ncbi:MAG: hypothetical protein AB7E55_33925 [Pigmentiphaga sp.]
MATAPKMRIDVVFKQFEEDHIQRRIDTALKSYRCQWNSDDDGDALGLADVLTPPGECSIALGKKEMELLSEHIFMCIVDDVWPDFGASTS